MLKPRYKLTQADRPQLLEALAAWKQLFNADLNHAQLITWAKAAPHSVLLDAFNVTHSWARGRKPSVVLESDAYKYTSGVIRNKMRDQSDAERLLGEANELLGGAR
jgi:hypothetical protein